MDKVDKISGTENPQGIDITFNNAINRVEEFLPGSKRAVWLSMAVTLSSGDRNNIPLWLLLVGVPSSGKTEVVRLLKDLPRTYFLDNLTLNAFISGERPSEKEKVHDLLPELDNKCLIVKDLTSLFSLDEKATKKILGDFVNIFDKEFSKFSSRRGLISYSTYFSQIGCITPATLNKHAHYLNMVGARFIFYSIPDLTEDQKKEIFQRILYGFDRSALEADAKKAVTEHLVRLEKVEIGGFPTLWEKENEYLIIAANLMANCRGIVMLQQSSFVGENGQESTYYEVLDSQIEQPWRGLQQLSQLAKYLALIAGKSRLDSEVLDLIKDVVLSSMPADRARALNILKQSNGKLTAKYLSELSDKSTKTSRRLLDELTALKVVEKIKNSANVANEYQIANEFKNFILLDSTEFMSHSERLVEDATPEEVKQFQKLGLEVISDEEMEAMPI